VLLLSGCALSGEAAFEEVRSDLQSRTGQEVAWHRDETARKTAREAVAAKLSRILTADDAVTIALLNNRMLQAHFEELGLARADVVQATLLPNPVFEGSYQGSTNDGADPVVEIALIGHVIELLTLPSRRKIAAERLEAVKADVSRQVLSLASEVRAQFYAVQSDEQMLEMLRHVVESTGATLEVARRLREAGNITDLELAQQQSLHSRARLHLAAIELQTMKERERFNILLGLWGDQVDVKIEPRLPEVPEALPDLEDIERRAVEANYALAAMRHGIEAEARELGLTRATAWFPELEAGAVFSKEDDGNRLLGPVISLPLPLFNQGQPRVRRARARLEQQMNAYYQKSVEVRAVARSAREHLRHAHERATYTKSVELPLARRITEQTQLEYNAMQLGVFDLLRAKEFEIDTGKRFIEDLRDYWTAHTEVEAVLQGHITEFGMQVTPLDEVPGSPLH
jgi:outer membrane protein, heavy metal efflux system